MKNNIKSLISIIIVVIIFSISGICHASDLNVRVGNESARVTTYGEEAGVCLLITDPKGRRAGCDPVANRAIEEFPATLYFSFDVRDEIHEAFEAQAVFNLIPGVYTIEFIGVKLTTYDIYINISRLIAGKGSKGPDFKTLKATFEGAIDKGLTSKYQFTYTSDPAKPLGSVIKLVSPKSLRQDIILFQRTGHVMMTKEGKYTVKSLLKMVEAVETSIAKGNKAAASNQLNAFISEVNGQSCDESSCPPGKHISATAAKMLVEDAQYLIKQLENNPSGMR